MQPRAGTGVAARIEASWARVAGGGRQALLLRGMTELPEGSAGARARDIQLAVAVQLVAALEGAARLVAARLVGARLVAVLEGALQRPRVRRAVLGPPTGPGLGLRAIAQVRGTRRCHARVSRLGGVALRAGRPAEGADQRVGARQPGLGEALAGECRGQPGQRAGRAGTESVAPTATGPSTATGPPTATGPSTGGVRTRTVGRAEQEAGARSETWEPRVTGHLGAGLGARRAGMPERANPGGRVVVVTAARWGPVLGPEASGRARVPQGPGLARLVLQTGRAVAGPAGRPTGRSGGSQRARRPRPGAALRGGGRVSWSTTACLGAAHGVALSGATRRSGVRQCRGVGLPLLHARWLLQGLWRRETTAKLSLL